MRGREARAALDAAGAERGASKFVVGLWQVGSRVLTYVPNEERMFSFETNWVETLPTFMDAMKRGSSGHAGRTVSKCYPVRVCPLAVRTNSTKSRYHDSLAIIGFTATSTRTEILFTLNFGQPNTSECRGGRRT